MDEKIIYADRIRDAFFFAAAGEKKRKGGGGVIWRGGRYVGKLAKNKDADEGHDDEGDEGDEGDDDNDNEDVMLTRTTVVDNDDADNDAALNPLPSVSENTIEITYVHIFNFFFLICYIILYNNLFS